MFPGASDVSQQGIVVYVTIAVVLVVAITTASERIAKVFGPIGRAWFDFAKLRREAAAAKRSADVAELQRQIDGLADALRSQSARHERQLGEVELRREADRGEIQHLQTTVVSWERWAYEATIAAARGGVTLPKPPSN
ncbi:hypothetical protein [Aeromicrobium endophyticum]|uniref:Uncharacterized protein n=1 Tax=Aeromicrobium endophyticum TaxID=2292704 RepID=A0A371PCH4_9ACTN|nr:hypothetical protein [Aeromicrobium endophyticum]REK73635.1 hypothetical protein DX116_08905 [Aeromicrobium endophyticum]